ncbi:hypothetical protein EFT54_13530 [Lacticaseibacillus paracasei]|nr:hypothetical protein [Lacticaseibacillus paracasei]
MGLSQLGHFDSRSLCASFCDCERVIVEREPARLATSHCSGFLLYSRSHYTPTNLIVKPSRSDKIFLYALIKELVFYSPSTVSWR